MGMSAVGKTARVDMNWTLWGKMLEILEQNGFVGELPSSNDGYIVSKDTAIEVGKAILAWYSKKPRTNQEHHFIHPELEGWESAILAYALLLIVDGERVRHF